MYKQKEIQEIVKSAVEDYCTIVGYDIIGEEDGTLFVGTDGKPFLWVYTVSSEDGYFIIFDAVVLVNVEESRKDKIEKFIESEDISTFLEENSMFLQFDDDNNLKLSYQLYQEDNIEKVLKSKALLITDLVGRESERFRDLIEKV